LKLNRMAVVCALAGASASLVHAQERRAIVHPQLEEVLERPSDTLPPFLAGDVGGRVDRKSVGGRESLSLHLRTTASRADLESIGVQVRTLRNGRATVTVPRSLLGTLAARPDVQSIALPRRMYPNLKRSLPDTGIPPLRTQVGGVWSGATGAGVIVGVVDSGLDVGHPNFQDAAGNTRILYLWDQTKNPSGGLGTIPAPYNYGTEWTAANIDNGLCTEKDELEAFGHGTHVTGTAAGNGVAPDETGVAYGHVGVAPASHIVFVKTTFFTDDITDGLNYIFDKADLLGLPCVINLSLGSNLGAHDGTDPMEEEIDDLVTAKAGRAVVVAAGNARDDATHAEVKAQLGVKVTGPSFVVPPYTAQAGAGNDYVVVSGYYATGNDITVHLVSPTGEAYIRGLTNTGCAAPINGFDGTVQLCNAKSSNLDQNTTAREMIVQVYDQVASKPPRAGTWTISVTGNTLVDSGWVDFWMASNTEGASGAARFSTNVDIEETLGVPSTSKEAITVGAYVTRRCWTDYTNTSQAYTGGVTIGDIAPFSSAGPTRDGRLKPELAAPGMGIVAPLADEVRPGLIAQGYGKLVVNDHYLLLQGTSMAAPHVTGAVALLLQSNPLMTGSALRTALRNYARTDSYTRQYAGFLGINYSFGSGKLDLGSWASVDANESNDVTTQATMALSGQTLTGLISRPDDVDYFALEGAKTGDTFELALTTLPKNYKLSLQSLSLLTTFPSCSNAGSTITKATSDNPGTADEAITFVSGGGGFQIPQGPPRYMRVASSAGESDTVGAYHVRGVLTRPETDDPHDTVATAQELPEFREMKVTGVVINGEPDYYAFTARTSSTITLSAPGKTVRVRDDDGTLLATGFGTVSYAVPSGGFFSGKRALVGQVVGLGGYTLVLSNP
jgi:subtilisin family serine protease